MTHPRIILATAVALATASFSGGAMAASYGYGFDGDHDRLGWVIVSGGNTSMSDMKDLESMEDLKSEFGDEFLYLRLGEDRYVIRDRALMKRAQDALEPMQEAGREIGEIARAHAQRALAGSKDVRGAGETGSAHRQDRATGSPWRIHGGFGARAGTAPAKARGSHRC